MPGSDRPAPGYPLPPDAVPAVRPAWAPAAGVALPPHYPGCFACGSDHPDGLLLRAVAGEGVSVTAQVDVTGAHQGAPGLAHGGIVASVLDETQGFVLGLLATAGVTAKLEIHYRRPVPIGHTVVTRGWCTGIAGRKVFTAADMHLDHHDGPLLAQSSGLFIIVGEEHFAPYLEHVAGSLAGRLRPADVPPRLGHTSINP